MKTPFHHIFTNSRFLPFHEHANHTLKFKCLAVNRALFAKTLDFVHRRDRDKSFVISLQSRRTTNELIPLLLEAINIGRRRVLALLVINYTTFD